MDPLSVDLTLAETAAHLRRARHLAQSAVAVPIQLLGGAWLILAPVALLVGRDHLAPFVGAALLAVTIVSWLRYRRHAAAHGVRARLWPWLAVAVSALVGGVITSRAGTRQDLPWLNLAGPFLVNATALGALGVFLRSTVIIGCALAIAVVSLAVATVAHGDVAVAVELGSGAALLLATGARLVR